MNIEPLTFIIGVIFSPLATLGAFFITYEEQRHHYSNKNSTFMLGT